MLFLKLFMDENFRSTVMPMLQLVYFNPPQGEYPYDLIFKYFQKFYIEEYEEITPTQILHAIQENEKFLDHDDLKDIKKTFRDMFQIHADIMDGILNDVDVRYLIDETEKFAQAQAIELALIESVEILEKKPSEKLLIRGIMDDALSVGLKRDVGISYLHQYQERFKFYQEKEDKIPFALESMNKATYQGFNRKTLNCFMAGTGIGKTLLLTSLTSDYIQMGYNVLYVTLEISEERIALRTDANLLDIPINDFGRYEDGKPVVNIDTLVQKFKDIKNNKVLGELRIKEFATGTINSLHIRALLKELKLKEKFTPDVIMIDYINLMNSSRLSQKTANSYTVVKAIAEELRGIAVEENIIMITATQTNRDGISGGEVALDKVSESAGLPHTTDFFCGIFQSEEQREQNIIILKILKNRFSGFVNRKVAFGIDYNFMRIFQLDEAVETEAIETNLGDDCSLDDNSNTVYTPPPTRKRRR